MAEKLTYEDAKKEFEKRGYELLETTYKNSKTKMMYRCPIHPDKELSITFGDLKQGKGCPYCGKERTAKKITKHTIESAKEEFKQHGYELLETKYKNCMIPMIYKCPKHPDKSLKISLRDLIGGHGCRYCGMEKAQSKTRISFESVKAEFEKRGYELLETEYKNDSTKMRYRCPKHPNEETRISLNKLKMGRGCRHCQYDSLPICKKGEENPSWKGGLTNLNTFLRDITRPWKYQCANKFKGRCFVTNEKGRDIEIHHPIPFHKLRDLALNALRLEIKESISDYTSEELECIESEFKRIHDQYEGFPMKKEIHKLFHKVYGDNVTIEQVYEFKERYDSGEFKHLRMLM